MTGTAKRKAEEDCSDELSIPAKSAQTIGTMCALIKPGGWKPWRCMAVATQIVMDHTGDTRHHFDAKDSQALAEAEERFKELMRLGFTAAVRTAASEVTRVRSFDPTAEETLFFPRLVGG